MRWKFSSLVCIQYCVACMQCRFVYDDGATSRPLDSKFPFTFDAHFLVILISGSKTQRGRSTESVRQSGKLKASNGLYRPEEWYRFNSTGGPMNSNVFGDCIMHTYTYIPLTRYILNESVQAENAIRWEAISPQVHRGCVTVLPALVNPLSSNKPSHLYTYRGALVPATPSSTVDPTIMNRHLPDE